MADHEDYLSELNAPRRTGKKQEDIRAEAKILVNEAVARLRHLHLPYNLDSHVTADDRSMLRRAGILWKPERA